ncbi:MAG TPA: hypothetical protein VMY87_02485 [Armatimonadota bacterium]|nr:hypothetical protein [Armatimonadota bacterium]
MPRSSGRGRRGRRRLRGRVFLGLLALVLVFGLVKLLGPLGTIRAQSDRLAQLRMKKAALLSEQGELERYKEYAATEAGQEAAARRLGYVRPGERRIVFSNEKAREDNDGEEAAGAAPGS